MPKFETHISVSAVTSALAVAFGTAKFGWDAGSSTLAFIAGAAGGLVPDLDHDSSKPMRLAGAIVGVAAAAGAISFTTAPGQWLHRPWSPGSVLLAAAGTYFIFNLFFMEIVKRRTKHRGLFHSLAVPFLYGGILACLAVPHGGVLPLAVWSVGAWGVLTHLVLDAAKSFSFNPLKVATADLPGSTWLWVVTALINLIAFTRLTRF